MIVFRVDNELHSFSPLTAQPQGQSLPLQAAGEALGKGKALPHFLSCKSRDLYRGLLMVEGQCEKLISIQKVQINILFLFYYYYYECIPLRCFKRGQKLPILSGQRDGMGASQRHKLPPSTSRSCYRDNLHKQSCCGGRNGVV